MYATLSSMISEQFIWLIPPVISVIFGYTLYYRIIPKSHPKNKAQLIMNLVKDCLSIFAKRSASSMAQILLYTSLAIFLLSLLFKTPLASNQLLATFLGGILMILSSVFSLKFIPKMTAKVIQDSKVYFEKGASLQFNTCAAISFVTYGLISLGLTVSYLFLGKASVIGYACGIVLTSVFLRIGGGLFKASANIADDHIAQHESNLPSHDVRNVASIMNVSGHIIGKILGFGSDMLGSYIFSVIATLIIFLSSAALIPDTASRVLLMQFPFYIMSVTLASGLIAYLVTAVRIKIRYQNALLEGLYAAILTSGVSVYFFFKALPTTHLIHLHSPFYAYLSGLIGAFFIAFTSEYLTSQTFSPAKRIAKQAEYRSVIATLNSLALGLKSNGIYIFYLIVISVISFQFGGIIGITLAALGMLTTTNTIFCITAFSPLSTTTETIITYSGEDTSRNNIRKLLKLGKTTVALGNVLASSSAILATLSLFLTLLASNGQSIDLTINITFKWLIGLIIGLTLPYILSGQLLKSLSTISINTIQEVYRQFKDIPYLLENKAKPDIIKAGDRNTRYCLDAMIVPGLLMTLTPLVIGYGFGMNTLVGFALGVFLTALNQTFYWATTGDVSNSALTHLQEGHFGGKEAPTFTSFKQTENIGVAFKDVLSPSLNILIKAVTIITSLIVVLLN